MRTIWKGAISFGLVTIPVKVFSATENHSVSFRQIHTADEGRIRYRKVCELDGEEVPGEEIGKGYVTADGALVQVTDEDLDALPLPSARTVEILGFLPIGSIDPYQLDRSYYLAPETGAAKPYVLLREALRRADKGAIAKLAMRGRETLALIRALPGERRGGEAGEDRGDGGEEVLGMHTLLWPDEIRPAAGVAPTERVTVREAELDLADTLMETLGPVDMSELHDEYRNAVEALVDAKLSGAAPARPGREPAGGRVVDLMAALEDSVRGARRGRGEEGEPGEEATVTPFKKSGPQAGKRPARKEAAKKTQPRKAAKKTTGARGDETARKATGKTAGKQAAKKAAQKKTAQKKTAQKKAAQKKAVGRKRAS
ncbi:Ku protein [Streptomyces hoynatensis]|uniref:Non-homologous end joining protein Ku n=1 Tax=Streptomyces hoynatensis TaxID=1141874 RepID=A0A3A9YQA2_9ACTN|nr:Ku protein [Streptomyces hoynatensis]RKN38155.1 Ku protein [Streptomyces hoynatensis]